MKGISRARQVERVGGFWLCGAGEAVRFRLDRLPRRDADTRLAVECGQVPGEIDVDVLGWGSSSGDPCYEFGDGCVDGKTVEVLRPKRWVGQCRSRVTDRVRVDHRALPSG